ncbi:MAG: DUF192 domain-containing protein [Cohaesibacter sp.]|nr:DUF192 domain-containing protein [Cohaesibacter sp.]
MVARKKNSIASKASNLALYGIAILISLLMAPSWAQDQASGQSATTTAPKAAQEKYFTPLIIPSEGKDVSFRVELAANDEMRAKGLMFRTKLPDGEGMLFDFGKPRPVYMWMENTYISLDMLFLNPDGTIHHIVKSTTPLSKSLIGSGGPVQFVLEVKAGTVERLKLKKGDQLQHQLFTSN